MAIIVKAHTCAQRHGVDPTGSSYRFRPGRDAHEAVQATQRYVAEGRRVVVDLDLERFFDRVKYDLLMGKLVQRIGDRRVLQLIRLCLQAGMMAEGLVSQRREGTPQGGSLSPQLSNILLRELDRELECRGHAFCRYANDCTIYSGLTSFFAERLEIEVKMTKRAVARPWERTFMAYSLTWDKLPRCRIAPSGR